jgi:hypothetical protein
MILRKLIVMAAWCMASSTCFAEWEIVSVTTEPFTRESYNGPPEVRMQLSLRNTADRDILVWGQTFASDKHFYLIDSFIQNAENTVWERQNDGICGSVGKTGWITVKPGQVIQQDSVLFRRYVGRNMILTFRRAYSEGDSKGSEILLGPFTVPVPVKSEQSPAGDVLKAASGE